MPACSSPAQCGPQIEVVATHDDHGRRGDRAELVAHVERRGILGAGGLGPHPHRGLERGELVASRPEIGKIDRDRRAQRGGERGVVGGGDGLLERGGDLCRLGPVGMALRVGAQAGHRRQTPGPVTGEVSYRIAPATRSGRVRAYRWATKPP